MPENPLTFTTKEHDLQSRAAREAERRWPGASLKLDEALEVSVDAWRGELIGLVRKAWGKGPFQIIALPCGGGTVTVQCWTHAESDLDEALVHVLETAP